MSPKIFRFLNDFGWNASFNFSSQPGFNRSHFWDLNLNWSARVPLPDVTDTKDLTYFTDNPCRPFCLLQFYTPFMPRYISFFSLNLDYDRQSLWQCQVCLWVLCFQEWYVRFKCLELISWKVVWDWKHRWTGLKVWMITFCFGFCPLFFAEISSKVEQGSP